MISNSVEDTYERARVFVSGVRPRRDKAVVVGLRGNLGAGKTTFMKGIAKALGVEQTVTSPTFVIEKIYKLKDKDFDHLIHIDAYRLDSGEELLKLGWDDVARDPKNLIFIEWPERVGEIIPRSARTIYFEFVDENTREIKMPNGN